MGSKKKKRPGLCEFMVYPDRGMGYSGARSNEAEPHLCPRPATVVRDGKSYCRRHDSELDDKDINEIVAMVDREEAGERRRREEEARRQRIALIRERLLGCPQCGEIRPLRTDGLCWSCYSENLMRRERDQRSSSRNELFGLAYGRRTFGVPGMPLNASKPEPQPESKPLQEQFGGKRRFLEDEDGGNGRKT